MMPPLSKTLPQTRIRLLTLADLEACEAIERESFDQPWTLREFTRIFLARQTIGFKAEAAGELVGYLIVEVVDPGAVWVLNLATAPAWRRRGVAAALLDKMVSYMPRGRIWRITAETRESNLAAQLFFRARGFWCRGVLKNVWRCHDEPALSFIRIGRRAK